MKTKVLEEKDLSNFIAIVVGTRPGIIKFSPVIRELASRQADFFIIHTGQHYSYTMDRQFFEELELPPPRFTNDKVRNYSSHGAQTAEMIKGVELACIEAKPSVVIVGGDANTNLAGAIAARKLVAIKLVHMEAGLRSFDWRMPEEHNRVMIDHISDILLAPTEASKNHLKKEAVRGQIIYTGNPIVDAVLQNVELAGRKSDILIRIGREPYVLVTCHREENVDIKDNILNVFTALNEVKSRTGLRVVFPCHPRTRRRIKDFDLEGFINQIACLELLEPVGYLDFLMMMQRAAIVMTDSGGVQEETCILKVPCLTIRDSTERPETVAVGSNMVVGTRPEAIWNGLETMLSRKRNWNNPFGDGFAAKRIADVLLRLVSRG